MNNSNLDTISNKIDRSSFEEYKQFESESNLDEASNNFWSILDKLDAEKNLKNQSSKDPNCIRLGFLTGHISAPGKFSSHDLLDEYYQLDRIKRNFKTMNIRNDVIHYPPMLDDTGTLFNASKNNYEYIIRKLKE